MNSLYLERFTFSGVLALFLHISRMGMSVDLFLQLDELQRQSIWTYYHGELCNLDVRSPVKSLSSLDSKHSSLFILYASKIVLYCLILIILCYQIFLLMLLKSSVADRIDSVSFL